MKLDINSRKEIDELLSNCKEKQGEYLPSHHGSGSWATTYSNEFITSAAKIYLILKKNKSIYPLEDLSCLFINAAILSCRRSSMSVERVEYLYNTHLRGKIDFLSEVKKNAIIQKKNKCNYCSKMFVDLIQHVSQAHPIKWFEYSQKNGVMESLNGKTRCSSCGSFLKSMVGHETRCPKNLE